MCSFVYNINRGNFLKYQKMNICKGNGSCLTFQQCECICYIEIHFNCMANNNKLQIFTGKSIEKGESPDCECCSYDDDIETIWDEICICGHRKHNGYCPNNCCCSLFSCPRCKLALPEYALHCHYGTCYNCGVKRYNKGGWRTLYLDGYLRRLFNDDLKFAEFLENNKDKLDS